MQNLQVARACNESNKVSIQFQLIVAGILRKTYFIRRKRHIARIIFKISQYFDTAFFMGFSIDQTKVMCFGKPDPT